eukprot:5922436-Prorocentrum_lima.AAC.1
MWQASCLSTRTENETESEEEAVNLETGEKYKPKTKPKNIEFGSDDCWEDMSSIAWVEDIS